MNSRVHLLLVVVMLAVTGKPVSGQTLGDMKKPFVFSNQFKHSAGAGVALYKVNEVYEPIYAIAYNPTLSLTRTWSDFSVSVGTHLMGGYHFSSSNDSNEFLFADLPLLVELNFGHNASKDFYNDLGWFFGGGYSYHLVDDNWYSGPEATIGFRTFIFGPSFTLRYSRYFATDEADVSLHNITLLLNLGKYFEQVKKNNKISRFSNGFRK